jgi:hypothetical protein
VKPRTKQHPSLRFIREALNDEAPLRAVGFLLPLLSETERAELARWLAHPARPTLRPKATPTAPKPEPAPRRTWL